MPARTKPAPKDSNATIGFEAKLWITGGKLCDISIYGQDKWARRQRSFGIANALPAPSWSCGSVKAQSNKGPNMLQLTRRSVSHSSSA